MWTKKNIFAINGSASRNSSNEKLIACFAGLTEDVFEVKVLSDLKILPHFDPDLTINNIPAVITEFRNNIEQADGVLICTPEYIFSIPGGLKNAIEWCVSTNVFSHKPVALITASASGQKGHEDLTLIMKTVMASFTDNTTLLIQGIKGKIDKEGNIQDNKIRGDLLTLIDAYKALVYDAEIIKGIK